MRVTFLPHALQQMAERGVSEDCARATLERPDLEYPGDAGRTVAERRLAGERSAIKVVYDLGPGGERVVVTVYPGRPRAGRTGGGDEE